MVEGGIFAARVTNNKGIMKTIVDLLTNDIKTL
jgi:hypothetical protein